MLGWKVGHIISSSLSHNSPQKVEGPICGMQSHQPAALSAVLLRSTSLRLAASQGVVCS